MELNIFKRVFCKCQQEIKQNIKILKRRKVLYLFKSSNPNGVHTYATYYDRKNKRYNAIQLTHLYVKDANRFKQLSKGNIMITKFKKFDVPSGVRNQYYNKNVNGGKIDLNDKINVVKVGKRYLSKKQSSQIKNFANKTFK